MRIELTDKTKKLLNRFDDGFQTNNLSLEDIRGWLAKDYKFDETNRLLYEQCFAALLHDTHVALSEAEFILKKDAELTEQLQKDSPLSARIKYALLALAGIFYFACEGYDGMAAMLSIFSLPGIVVMLLGGLFALLSVAVFVAFDLNEIAENLGIKKNQSNALIDAYFLQQQHMEQIRAQIAMVDKSKIASQDLMALRNLVQLFIIKNKQFQQLEANYKSRKKKWHMVLMRKAAGLIAGSLFFASGFFTAQSISIALVALMISSAGPTTLPVILLCLVGGLAGFCLYYYVQRPLVERFASWALGIDMDKWEQFINDNNELTCKLAETENALVEFPAKQDARGDSSTDEQNTSSCSNKKESLLSKFGVFGSPLPEDAITEDTIQSALVI